MNIDLLFDAVNRNNHKVLERLIEQSVDINARNKHGYTVLIQASICYNPHLVKIILEHGADPNIKTRFLGFSALYWACDRGCVETIKLLLSHGANVNILNDHNVAPLHLTSLYGHTEATKLLLENGADVNAKDIYGDTPLHQVALGNRSNVETAIYLIGHGANKNIKNDKGKTAYDIAKEKNRFDLVPVLNNDDNIFTSNSSDPLTSDYLISYNLLL